MGFVVEVVYVWCCVVFYEVQVGEYIYGVGGMVQLDEYVVVFFIVLCLCYLDVGWWIDVEVVVVVEFDVVDIVGYMEWCVCVVL